MIAHLMFALVAATAADSSATCLASLERSFGVMAAVTEMAWSARTSADSARVDAGITEVFANHRATLSACPSRIRPPGPLWRRFEELTGRFALPTYRVARNAAPGTIVLQRRIDRDSTPPSYRDAAAILAAMPHALTIQEGLNDCENSTPPAIADIAGEVRDAVGKCTKAALAALLRRDTLYHSIELAYLESIQALLLRIDTESRKDLVGVIQQGGTNPPPLVRTPPNAGASLPTEFWINIRIEVSRLGEDIVRQRQSARARTVTTLEASPAITFTDGTTSLTSVAGYARIASSLRAEGGAYARYGVTGDEGFHKITSDSAGNAVSRHTSLEFDGLWQFPRRQVFVHAAGSLLADNSLGLSLQHNYVATAGYRVPLGSLSLEGSVGAAVVVQNFSSGTPSTSFAAAALTVSAQYIVNAKDSLSESTVTPIEVAFTTTNLGGRAFISSTSASLKMPTTLPRLSFLLRSSLQYVSNTPASFRKHFLAIEFGPQVSFGTSP
jgi:hypothetical protein